MALTTAPHPIHKPKTRTVAIAAAAVVLAVGVGVATDQLVGDGTGTTTQGVEQTAAVDQTATVDQLTVVERTESPTAFAPNDPRANVLPGTERAVPSTAFAPNDPRANVLPGTDGPTRSASDTSTIEGREFARFLEMNDAVPAPVVQPDPVRSLAGIR